MINPDYQRIQICVQFYISRMKFNQAKMKYICGSCFMPRKVRVGTRQVRKLFYFVKIFYKQNSVKI